MNNSNWIEEKRIQRARGDLLFREGDVGEQMFVIISGRVGIFKDVDGKRIELAQLEKGDFFGEMGLLDRLPRTASAEVLEDADLLVISPADFDEMLKKNTEIAVRIMRKYSQRLRGMLKVLEEQHRPVDVSHGSVARPRTPQRGFESLLGNLKSVERGHLYPINSTQVLIGRRDAVTGIVPDIDLFEEDMLNSVSRQHAWIDVREGQMYLTEEVGVVGGTYVNDTRLVPGQPVLLKNGDKLRFGYVLLTFLSKS
jgi:CRP-like cAMP-binding protein